MKAIITGISGQDGFYLSKLLLEKNYEVYGFTRSDLINNHLSLSDKINILGVDYSNFNALKLNIDKICPDVIYHLASDVNPNFDADPSSSIDVNLNITISILEILKISNNKFKLFVASTSLIFGPNAKSPQNENTIMDPDTPYGICKLASLNFCKMYRKAYGLFISTGILYNHESILRNEKYIIRKITKQAAKIYLKKANNIVLGNIDIKRDWGFAGDFVEAFELILNNDFPDDYIIGTGELYSIRDVLNYVFEKINCDYNDYLLQDKSFIRKLEHNNLQADITKIKKELGWYPKKHLYSILDEMLENDIKILRDE